MKLVVYVYLSMIVLGVQVSVCKGEGREGASSAAKTKCCGRVSNALVIRFRSTSWVNFSVNRAL